MPGDTTKKPGPGAHSPENVSYKLNYALYYLLELNLSTILKMDWNVPLQQRMEILLYLLFCMKILANDQSLIIYIKIQFNFYLCLHLIYNRYIIFNGILK